MVTRGMTGWRLPMLVLVGGLLVGGLLIVFGGLRAEPASTPRSALATVVTSAPCGPAPARDTVRVDQDELTLDGCGNPVGTELNVELLDDGRSARLTGTGPSPGSELVSRLSVLLLVLAGLGGAALTSVVAARRVS